MFKNKVREQKTAKLLKELQLKSYSEVLLVLEKQIGLRNPATLTMLIFALSTPVVNCNLYVVHKY